MFLTAARIKIAAVLSASVALLSVTQGPATAGVFDDVADEAASAQGVVVLAGIDSAAPAIRLARAAPVVVLAVTDNPQATARLRDAFRAAGVLGQVTAETLPHGGRVPLTDNTAALVVADLDTCDGLTPAELHRIARPWGRVVSIQGGKRQEAVIERPAGADDWSHYHKDATSSEHSEDITVGPARGLQWIAGPTLGQPYNLVMQDTALMLHGDETSLPGRYQLIARDAFSGLPLWINETQPNNRFCIVAGDELLYIHYGDKNRVAFHTSAVDRRSGETLFEFTEGFDFTVADEEARQDRHAYPRQKQRAEDLQLRLAEGCLVQTMREGIRVLDTTTGKLKWKRDAAEGHGFVHPVIEAGVLYVVEGEYARRSSYTHWPMATPDTIHAFRLTDGAPKWQVTWDEKRYGTPHAVYNLQIEGDRLCGAVTIRTERKPQAHGLVLDSATGKHIYFGRETKAWPGSTGAGHSHARLHLRGDQAWTFEIGGPIARWDVDQPEDYFSFMEAYKGNMRPVSCTVWRSTPNWWFGGVASYPASGEGRAYFNNSGRSNCDIGAFPANGLLYSPPNTCQCQPYLPANKVYHSRTFTPPSLDLTRLEKTAAGPAAVTKQDADSWPQWQRDPARRAWQDADYPTDLKQAWQVTQSAGQLPELLRTQWNSDAIIRGTVSQAVAAEGVVVFAVSQRHEVVGVDADTGAEKWRTRIDGRVDMAPSIHRGLVFCGTRNGYVYALNRDTGATVWRFLAAPHVDRLVVNGQLESPWPVFGSITIDDEGLIAIAGRHSDTDGGLWWWRLDPPTGDVLAHGRLGDNEPPAQAANLLGDRPLGEQPTQNSVALMTDRWFLLPGCNIRRINGRLGAADDTGRLDPGSFAGNEEIDAVQMKEHFMRYGRNAIIGERPVTVGGWRKPFYAKTLARIFAIRGTDVISVGGGPYTAGGRGGGGGSEVHRMKLLAEPVIERRTGKRNVEPLWVNNDKLMLSRGIPSVSALAVSNNAVFLGMSIYGRDAAWRKAAAEMPHRLRILSLADGTHIRDVAVPGRVLQGGIALAGGRVYVATEDGSVTAFAAAN